MKGFGGLVGLGLGLGLSGRSVFSPISLFAASEPGFWYDPSDMTTLFQDNWGVTPVSAVGQSVGLALDKRLGLAAIGSDLASDDLTTWTKAGTATTPTAATATFPASNDFIFISPAVSAGKAYEIRAVLSGSGTLTFGAYATTAGFAPALGNITLTTTPTEYVVTRYYLPGDTDRRVIIGRIGSATATGVTVGSISVRELPGNHATQSTSLSRPTYQVDSNGRGYLLFDGVDDFLVTGTITPGVNKAQVFAGVTLSSNAASGVLAELSATSDSSAGSFSIWRPPSGGGTQWYAQSRGSAGTSASASGYGVGTTQIFSALSDISGDVLTARVDGAQVAQSTADQGTGNYLAYPFYIGRRGGTTAPFNGRIYSMICRFGPNLTADQITQTEAWVNARTGAY